MSKEIVVITPEREAGRGGLADYTLRLVEAWGDAVSVRLVLPAEGTALAAELPAQGGRVLLQYSAYGYDRFGYPRALLHALTNWKRKSGGLLVVMCHEIWTFWPVLNKNYLIQQLHRRDLRTLLACADAAFSSTASQAEHLRQLGGRAVEVLPVGSNIRCTAPATREREAGLVVLFGLQGSRLRALQAAQRGLQELAAAQIVTRLVTIGGGNTPAGDAREWELLETLPLARGHEQRGALAEAEVSVWLTRASFGLSAQDELSATKSGTLMAYAAHGLNVLALQKGATEPLFWATTPAELRVGIPEHSLGERRQALQEWQERTCSWPRLAQQFARALRIADA